MDRRIKATQNRDRALRLREEWGVEAEQVRYSDDGHWYASLSRFPAALFDANGFIRFATEQEYRESPYLNIGKQISVPKPGISAIPGYVLINQLGLNSKYLDVDIHNLEAIEGRQRLVTHLQRERNKSLVQKKKQATASLECEICGFSFRRIYGDTAKEYCEAHHIKQLSDVEDTVKTSLEDLAILCANCHRVVHIKYPPYTLDEVRKMICEASKA